MYISRIYLKYTTSWITKLKKSLLITLSLMNPSQDAILQANVANLNTLDASEEQPHTPMSTENSTAAAVPPPAPKKAKKSNMVKGKPLKRQKSQFDDEEESKGENSGSTSLVKNINKNTFAYFIRLITKQT